MLTCWKLTPMDLSMEHNVPTKGKNCRHLLELPFQIVQNILIEFHFFLSLSLLLVYKYNWNHTCSSLIKSDIRGQVSKRSFSPLVSQHPLELWHFLLSFLEISVKVLGDIFETCTGGHFETRLNGSIAELVILSLHLGFVTLFLIKCTFKWLYIFCTLLLLHIILLSVMHHSESVR